jgi:predicted HTH domain antitoxin
LSLKESKEDFAKEMLFNNALILYRKGKLSLGKAAQLAGYDRIDFIRLMQIKGEAIFDYPTGIIENMINGAERAKHLCGSGY